MSVIVDVIVDVKVSVNLQRHEVIDLIHGQAHVERLDGVVIVQHSDVGHFGLLFHWQQHISLCVAQAHHGMSVAENAGRHLGLGQAACSQQQQCQKVSLHCLFRFDLVIGICCKVTLFRPLIL